MESARAFAPLREGGVARRKMACGLRVWSGWKGRRGEYCGWPSMQAFACSICGGIDSFVSVRSRAFRDGRPQYSPRRGPCRLSFAMHPLSIHGRATPLSEGGGACRPSCSVHSWDSRGGSTIIPEEPRSYGKLKPLKIPRRPVLRAGVRLGPRPSDSTDRGRGAAAPGARNACAHVFHRQPSNHVPCRRRFRAEPRNIPLSTGAQMG